MNYTSLQYLDVVPCEGVAFDDVGTVHVVLFAGCLFCLSTTVVV